VRDAEAIPRFDPRTYADYGWLNIDVSVLLYVTVVVVLLLVGYRRLLVASR
jgi:ABC-2 type transport system permease protein